MKDHILQTTKITRTSALLVIDIQKLLTIKNELFRENQFFDSVNLAISKFRDLDKPIIFVQHNNKFLIHDTTGWEIDDRIDISLLDYTLQKHHADAFRNTNLKQLLHDREVSQVFICGLASHSCVKYTCFGSLANGFKTILLQNAHSCWKRNAQELIDQTEIDLARMGVLVLTPEEL
jgi:nicotinamidase-related amidase